MVDRNIGNLPEMTAVEIDPDSDLLIVWDDSATGIERTKAMLAEQVREFMVTAHNLDPLAHPNLSAGGSTTTITRLAGQILSGFRVVVLTASNAAIYADNTIVSHATRVIGITLNAANLGSNVVILPFGEINEATWSWTPELPIYLSSNGVLTQNLPLTGFILPVATAIDATRIFVNIKTPILR